MKALILAQHMHGMIVGHGLKAIGILGLGLVVLIAGFARVRPSLRWGMRTIGAIVLGVGGLAVADTLAMSHNHKCHNHTAQDICSGPIGAEASGELHYLTHDHWLGWAAVDEPTGADRDRDREYLDELRRGQG